MKVLITARHFSISEKTRKHVEEDVQQLLKIFDRITSVNIVFEKIKDYEYETDIVVNVPLKTLTIHEKADEMSKSLDIALEKMRRQLKKYKEQL
ncbi:MAG: ribosome-associated translation inhibitor RaiA [Candidatus Neomarinimicrobiota bacterium]